MPEPQRHFIGRDGAAPALVVCWCRGRWPEALPAGLVFCVPTSLALRRLRDALADAYGAYQGVRFLTPPLLPTLFAPPTEAPVATQAEMLCAWSRVFAWLHANDPDGEVLACLFPGRRAWLGRVSARYALGRRLMRLRATLAECRLDFAAVAAHPRTALLDARERGRWAALDVLETRYREVLAEAGLEDPEDRLLAILRNPQPQPIEAAETWRLVVAGVPDLWPALTDLFALAPGGCDVLVQAGADETDRFTAAGLPDPEWWAGASLDVPGEALRVAENPSSVAHVAERFLNAHGTVAPDALCLGVLDREAIPPFTAMLAAHGVTAFEPEPIALGEQPPARALLALAALTRDNRLDATLPLLALPEVAKVLGAPYRTLRADYDALVEAHRPETRADARAFAKGALADFLARCDAWAEGFRDDPVVGAKAFLAALYGETPIDPVRTPLRFAAFEALRNLFAELTDLRVGGTPDAALLTALLADAQLRPTRGDADCAYEGRLELLWSSAPILILAGLTEGLFPDTTFEDAFLPNAFRRALGLRSDLTRVARDAYILDTICGWRDRDDLCLVVARANARGDWLKPSRLLFRCAPAEQARRARKLFVEPTRTAPPPEAGTALAFAENPVRWSPDAAPPSRLSPSAIAAYLASPLEFWLSRVLGLADTDDLPDGMSSALLGTLTHEALQTLRMERAMDAETLTRTLVAAFDACFAKRYGRSPTVELLAARQSILHRLRAAARLDARLREEGWETRHVEARWETGLTVGGHTVTLLGTVDRVDYNANLGRWRIFDYKTGTVAGGSATRAHWSGGRGEVPVTWKSFQLPIYRLLARHALGLGGREPIEAAYFALPEEGQAEIMIFEDPAGGEEATLAALRKTLAAILALGREPLPAAVGPYGNPLLVTLTEPTLEKEKDTPCD